MSKFQSTRPAWGATRDIMDVLLWHEFQSTRPAWGATGYELDMANVDRISIHTPRVGRDQDIRLVLMS